MAAQWVQYVTGLDGRLEARPPDNEELLLELRTPMTFRPVPNDSTSQKEPNCRYCTINNRISVSMISDPELIHQIHYLLNFVLQLQCGEPNHVGFQGLGDPQRCLQRTCAHNLSTSVASHSGYMENMEGRSIRWSVLCGASKKRKTILW